MPIVTYVRGARRALTLDEVKSRLAAWPGGGFDGLTDSDRRYIESAHAGAADVRFEQITERAFFEPAHSISLPVIGVTVGYRLTLSKSVPTGARVRDNAADDRKFVETLPLRLEVDYRVRIRPFSGTWQIGFVQTVDSLARSIRYASRAQPARGRIKDRVIRTSISTPVRDAPTNPHDTARPWFDPRSVREITAEYAHDTLDLTDYPGMLIEWKHASHVITLDARQSFTTYFVLRQSSGVGNALADAAGQCVILARWQWSSWFKLDPPSQDPTGGYAIASVEELADSAAIPAIENEPVGKDVLVRNQTVSEE